MEKKNDIESYNTAVVSIFHYDFVNRDNRHIKTTKWVATIHGIPIEGTSELLNDETLFALKNHQVTFDGKKWIVLK